jgi:putative ABC transport system permease protein
MEFIVRGIYAGGDEKTLYFSHEYLNESLPDWAKDKVGTLFIMASAPSDIPRISQTVDSMFLNTDAPTKTESEREFAQSFETMMGSVKQFMYGIMAAITFSLLLVMANTMAMSVRERTREVGTLKALGFQRGTIAWLFVGESLLVATVGAALGIGIALMVFRSIDLSLYIPNFISFIPAPETLAAAFALALFVGVASVIYSAHRVSGMTIAEALRSTE